MAVGQPFGDSHYTLRGDAAADAVTLDLTTPEEAGAFGGELVAMDPWARLGSRAESLARSLAESHLEKRCFTVRYGSERAGVVVIRFPWLGGPYLNLLAILAPYQGKGIGRATLDWMESEARATSARNCWLCVSAFNSAAIGFYKGCGYCPAALLDDLIKDGEDELLMRKRIV
jgi:ribosomal protein S18 acetylase RimI-like enzyme